jgi:3-oxoacyl-[acyl-carrier protein] reductase
MRLQHKIAIVTGGGSGFGEGIVRKFLAEGASVLVADRDRDAAERVAAESSGHARAFVGDVSKPDEVKAMVNAAQDAFGGLDIVINNAGVGHTPQPLEEIDEQTFDRIAAINMKAIYYTARSAVPYFKEKKDGVILNVASTGGVSPRPNLTWYNASKGWVITATRAMAIELAPFNIRVNAINPVAGDTPLLSTFMGGQTDELRRKFVASIPLGRLSTPEDMGNAAAFLCSAEASMITGVALEVDGGRCI